MLFMFSEGLLFSIEPISLFYILLHIIFIFEQLSNLLEFVLYSYHLKKLRYNVLIINIEKNANLILFLMQLFKKTFFY